MPAEIVRFCDLSQDDLRQWETMVDSVQGYESPFFHPHFTRIVSRHRNDVFVILEREADAIQLVLPVHKSGRTAFPIGAPFSDYHGPVVSPDWDGHLGYILQNVNISHYRFTSLYDLKNRFVDLASETDGTFVCDISSGSAAYFENQRNLFPKHAKKMRRLNRKIQREVGQSTFCFDDKDNAAWDTLMTWKRAQYRSTGRHDVLAPDWVRSMFLDLWNDGVEGCHGIFHTLKIDGHLVAGEFNLASKHTLHGWIPAYDHQYSSYTPGFLLQDQIISTAADEGIREYDLGVSAGHYKKYYSQFQLPVLRGTAHGSGTSVRSASLGSRVWNTLEGDEETKVGALAGKIRRRYGIIRTVEPTVSGRLKGIALAAGQILRPSTSEAAQETADTE